MMPDQGNLSTLVTDLITTVFDVLSNAITRTETTETINVFRSFLANKLPVLLGVYAPMILSPLSIETCITEAINRMGPSADPYSSNSFDLLSGSGMLSEARQDFLFACALHGLIPERSIEKILGDVPMQSLPESGKYHTASLVMQCKANPARIEVLIGELDNQDGNCGDIAHALVEV